MNSLLYHEIFELFNKTEKRADKINILRIHGDNNLREFLIAAFNPNVVFDVEISEYKSAVEPEGLNILYLHNEVQRLYRFIVGHPRRPPGLTSTKQKGLLTMVLESLHKSEAELLIRCIKKDLHIPFLTPKLIKEAFPGIDLGI